MGYFDDLDSVPERGGSNRFAPGIYPAIRVERLHVTQGHFGTRFVLEGTVVAEPQQREEGVQPTPVGAQGSWTTQIDGQYPKIGKGEVKALMRVLMDGEEPTGAETNRATGPENPYKGALIATDAWSHVTKNKHTITKHAFKPVPEGTVIHDVPVPTMDATPAAPSPAPMSPEGKVKAAGWLANPNAPGWYYNPANTAEPQRQIHQF